MPGLCDFESFFAATAALSVEVFELSVVEVGIGTGKMKSVDSSFGYNMLALGVGTNRQANKGPNNTSPYLAIRPRVCCYIGISIDRHMSILHV